MIYRYICFECGETKQLTMTIEEMENTIIICSQCYDLTGDYVGSRMNRDFQSEGCSHAWKSGICNPNTGFAGDIEEAEHAWIKNGKAPVSRESRKFFDSNPKKVDKPLRIRRNWQGAPLGTIKKPKVSLT